jgi:hypothetical protein
LAGRGQAPALQLIALAFVYTSRYNKPSKAGPAHSSNLITVNGDINFYYPHPRIYGNNFIRLDFRSFGNKFSYPIAIV